MTDLLNARISGQWPSRTEKKPYKTHILLGALNEIAIGATGYPDRDYELAQIAQKALDEFHGVVR